jgi:hypothetical protein
MRRREFVAGTAAMAAAPALSSAQGRAANSRNREVYDLRVLTFSTRESLDRYAHYLQEALLPSVRKLGLGTVGAFTVADKPDSLTIYRLWAFPNLAAFPTAEEALLQNPEYLKLGASLRDLPATDPPYTHCDSSLSVAFESWPSLKPPKEAKGDQPRVFELRIYESHSRKANLKKIEMFNKGESAIFARCGFQPVFFGETLTGPQIPNLTYMVTYPSIEARGDFWKAFGADPEKARLFAIPEYADKLIVSKIHSTFLKPLPGSMI